MALCSHGINVILVLAIDDAHERDVDTLTRST